jgi:hypothetical protein
MDIGAARVPPVISITGSEQIAIAKREQAHLGLPGTIGFLARSICVAERSAGPVGREGKRAEESMDLIARYTRRDCRDGP